MFKLQEKPLSTSMRLQQAARTGSKAYVRRGEHGPHILALQKALNLLRKGTFGYKIPGKPSMNLVSPNWPVVSENRDFDRRLYDAIKSFQNYANRFQRFWSHLQASDIGQMGSRGYKKKYYEIRVRVARDGIAGPVTLGILDEMLAGKRYLDQKNASSR